MLAYVVEERGRRDCLNIYRLRVHWDPFCLLVCLVPLLPPGDSKTQSPQPYLWFNWEASSLGLLPALVLALLDWVDVEPCHHDSHWASSVFLRK